MESYLDNGQRNRELATKLTEHHAAIAASLTPVPQPAPASLHLTD